MNLMFLKSKLHRATVTDADLNYEGSISIDPKLCEAANLKKFERVEIYNCNNGERFATYVIYGKENEICINGAAARLAQKGDQVIICSYSYMDEDQAKAHKARIVLLGAGNEVNLCKDDPVLG